MLAPIAMGFISATLNYTLQCINGGLLNVAFSPISDSTSKQWMYEFDMSQERLMQYLKAVLMVSGKDLPLEVLRTFPESIGGGDAGVKTAQENPNREVVFIIGPMVAAILMLIAILGLILISFCTCATCCCRCCKGKERKSRAESTTVSEVDEASEDGENKRVSPNTEKFDNGYDGYGFYGSESDEESKSDTTLTFEGDEPKDLDSVMQARQEKMMEKVEALAKRSKFVRQHQGCFCCGCHIFTVLLAIVYVVGLVVFSVFCTIATQQVAEVMEQPTYNVTIQEEQVKAWMENNSTYYNLADTISFALQRTNDLLDDVTINLITNLNETIGGLEGNMNTILIDGLESLLTNLQGNSGLSGVYSETAKLSLMLRDLLDSVEKTVADRSPLVSNLEALQEKFKKLNSDLESECPDTDCSYNDLLDVLLIDFDKSKFQQPSDSTAIKTMVESFSGFAERIEELQEQMDKLPGQLVANIIPKLDLVSQISKLEEQLNGILKQTKPQIESGVKQVLQYVDMARPYVGPALYAPAVIMAVIALIFTACLLLFIAEAFHRRLFSPTGEGPSELAEVLRTKRRSHICGGCRFLICSILFILLIIVCLAAAVVLVVCSLLAVEVCPYVYMEQGMNQSDYVLNSILAGDQSDSQQQQRTQFFYLAPPQNVLYGLSVVCAPTDATVPKLLPSVGIDSMMDVSSILEDEDFQNNIQHLIKSVADEVSNAISGDMFEQLEKMKAIANALRVFLASIDSEAAVKELSKFTGDVLVKLDELYAKVETDGNVRENVVQDLKDAINELRSYQGGIKKLQDDYKGLEAHSSLPDYFISYISTTEQALEHLKDVVQLQLEMETEISDLMETILKLYEGAVNGLIAEILPCGNLHYVLKVTVATVCSSSGLINRFFGWALALTLAILFSFLSFVGLFNLWCIQSHQTKRFYGP
ncbi:hypothetical protein TcWFU_001442 [Taenia crassiceps]|uniref:Protein tweety homolog n=1 Tax=Taenia crassiceps TaxID=6207 RepID=A0ABR4Q3I6_9CEST